MTQARLRSGSNEDGSGRGTPEPSGASQFVKSPIERQPRLLQSSEKSDSIVSIHTRPARMEAEWRERTERNLRQQQKEEGRLVQEQQQQQEQPQQQRQRQQQTLGSGSIDEQEEGLEGELEDGFEEEELRFGLRRGSGSEIGLGLESISEKGGAILGSFSDDDRDEADEMSERHNEAKAAAAWTYAKESGTPMIIITHP